MDSTVHGAAKSRTQLSDFHFHFQLKSWRGEGLVGPVLEVCLCWADTGHPQGKQALGPPPQHPARLTLGRQIGRAHV